MPASSMHTAFAVFVLCTPSPMLAQMPMDMSMPAERILGIPESRDGSGTSWLPDASPMRMVHYRAASWTLMLHGAAFGLYDDQGGPRGADRVAALDSSSSPVNPTAAVRCTTANTRTICSSSWRPATIGR
jgi:hypothetical protein